MGRFGLLGKTLSHSYSPLIHGELGDYEYSLFEKKPEELREFLLHDKFDGINVTIPYKTSVIPYCTRLSEQASAIGSVNTITRLPGGALYGDNTDYFGFFYLLKKAGVEPASGKSIILGSGGSSRTVLSVLRDLGATEVVVVSRTGPDNYQNIDKHKDAVLIVNTTPVGMYPNNGISPPIDLKIFYKCRTVIDLIYNPSRTKLLQQAEKLGISNASGLSMLVAQAKRASELFTRTHIPDDVIPTIVSVISQISQNIVLIGMPGSGKSSIGASLAETMSRKFVDTDEWVERAAGKPIPEVFADDGEENFRKMETEALKELCKLSGFIISTGGGIVKRQENLDIIRQNGVVFFLDRDVGELPVSGRPLSQRDGVAALAEERLPLYSQWSDYTVAVRGVEQTAADILNFFSGSFEE